MFSYNEKKNSTTTTTNHGRNMFVLVSGNHIIARYMSTFLDNARQISGFFLLKTSESIRMKSDKKWVWFQAAHSILKDAIELDLGVLQC